MAIISQSRWGLRSITFVVWILAAGTTVYWALRLTRGPVVVTNTASAAAPASINPLSVAQILGATPAQPVMQASFASRFSLQGVVNGSPGGGAALISIDGQPARPFRVGSAIENNLILQSASARQVTLAATQNGPALATIEMPALGN